MSDRDYLIALSTFTLFGPIRIRLLLSYFGSAKKIWKADRNDLVNIGLSEKLAAAFIGHRKTFDWEKYNQNLKKLAINVLTLNDANYPQNLKDIHDAPYVLYARGDLKKSDSHAVAIVGTRMMTSYGREVAERFAGELGAIGITVVSGLALGIDAAAQRACLNAGGRTISVLASGLNIISPAANRALALEFIKNNGAIVSEYPVGHTPFPSDFPVRDRLISGMSKAVIVIEGSMKSGTFYTVKAAADQGRSVFAVPGPITSPASVGPNYLIQTGAKPVTSIRDVLDEIDIQFKVDIEAVEKILPENPLEAKIVAILEHEPLHLDELVRISGMPTSEVSGRLTIMEMKGMVRNLGNGIYKRI